MNELEKKTYEELIERRGVLAKDADQEGADLDAIEKEIRSINEEIERRRAAEADEQAKVEKREMLRGMVANGAGETLGKFEAEKEKKKMPDMKEIRSSAAYINAWVEDVKEGKYVQTRKLLTENSEHVAVGDGVVPVPVIVEDRIRAAWENNELASRIRRTYFRGNLKVGYEESSTGAVIHEEGDKAVDDEVLTFGVISLIPAMIKKAIAVSDELIDMKGQEFIDYLFDEFENKIVARLCEAAIDAVSSAPTTNGPTEIGIPVVNATVITLDLVAQALALLTNDNANPAIVMNRGTFAAFRAAALNANYAVDPFEGLPVVFTSALPSIATADADDVYMIVGDLSAIQANFPAGDQVSFIFDPYTRKKEDLVEITGKLYVAVGVTEPGMLVRVANTSNE